MLGVIEVEDADSQGLLNVDTDLAYHVIDLMLGGDPAAAPVPTTRTFTSIDMSVCRLPLDELVSAFVEAVSSTLGRPLAKRVAIRDQRQNISQIQVAPDYVDVLVLSIMLDIGEAARTGTFDLMLPLAALDTILAAFRGQSGEAARHRPADLWKVQMRRTAAAAPVRVDAVLHRQALSVAAIQALRPGDLLEIPGTAPDEVQLTIAQPGERTAVIATGRLGAYQGAKVVKLATPIDPRVHDHVKRAL
jgi:flagellar motor switch protein FliM